METVVGIFNSNFSAERAVERLRTEGISDDRLTLLRPGTSEEQVERSVPTSDTESPGMGEALGGAVGGAIGAASGATLGLAVASLFLPGVGPILIAGALGAAIIGAGGAMAGTQAGEALEEALATGLPHDELFIYEDALRHGRSVVIASADNEEMAERVRKVLNLAGAESVDAARESWWLGIRDAEELEYEGAGGNFKQDETSYRQGFQAALSSRRRGRTFSDTEREMHRAYGELCSARAFRAGYERGQAYLRANNKAQSARGSSGR